MNPSLPIVVTVPVIDDLECQVADTDPDQLRITWRHGEDEAVLDANLTTLEFTVTANGVTV